MCGWGWAGLRAHGDMCTADRISERVSERYGPGSHPSNCPHSHRIRRIATWTLVDGGRTEEAHDLFEPLPSVSGALLVVCNGETLLVQRRKPLRRQVDARPRRAHALEPAQGIVRVHNR